MESDSGLVRPRRELVTSAVASLVDQIEMLGDPDPLVICVGKVAWSGVTDNLALLREAWGSADPNVVGIPHYSGANNGVHGGDPRRYRAIVAELLDGPLRRLRR